MDKVVHLFETFKRIFSFNFSSKEKYFSDWSNFGNI
jgi:hypothetical protein